MAVAGYEITLVDTASFVGLGDFGGDPTLVIPNAPGLGTSPLILPPTDRQTQTYSPGIFRPKDGLNTIQITSDVSWIDVNSFSTLQKEDMVLVSGIDLQVDLGALAAADVTVYISVARPGFYPFVIATGALDVMPQLLRDCAAVVPPSWGLAIRVMLTADFGTVVPGEHTLFFTLNQLKDTHDIADGIAAVLGVAGGAGTIITQDEGIVVDPASTTLNFIGPGVTAVPGLPGVTDVTIPGGGGGVLFFQDILPIAAPVVAPAPLGVLTIPPTQPASLQLDINGDTQVVGVDYTLLGAAITWLGVFPVIPTDDVVAYYV